MPIYEYECPVHGVFEVEQKITSTLEPFCPTPIMRPVAQPTHADDVEGPYLCVMPVKRLISRTSFTLKGKGWARDGYAG